MADGFDTPLFKQLAHNDTGAAAGHQGGIVIPLALDAYFPQLSGKTSTSQPTIDENIEAILVVDGNEVARVKTRYQYQTWGGQRSAERRITGNLGPLRDQTVADDILLIERNLEDRKLYRLSLVRQGTPDHASILKASGGARWGSAVPSMPPVKETEIEAAEQHQQQHETEPFELFDNDAVHKETRAVKIARGRAFQKLTKQYYGGKCAVCGQGFVSLQGAASEIEAAHIVPRGRKGADDARNGIALCRSHHWAFDQGLWGVKADGTIDVAAGGSGKGSNDLLKLYLGKKLNPPVPPQMAPAAEALAWHMNERFGKTL